MTTLPARGSLHSPDHLIPSAMPVSSRRLLAPAGHHGLVLNHTVEHGSSGQYAIISGFCLSPILGKPSLAKAAATQIPIGLTADPRVRSSGAFGRRPHYLEEDGFELAVPRRQSYREPLHASIAVSDL